MKRALPIVLVLAGCMAALQNAHPPCNVDSDCGEGQLCFPDGCGDPGSGLAVEVTGKPVDGLNAQDFSLGDAGFAPVQDFTLSAPMSLSGHFLRDQAAGKPSPYSAAVSLQLIGQSQLIPGVVRSYQTSFSALDQGVYSLPVGAGVFTAFASTPDTSIPPLRENGLTVDVGESPNLDFTFASLSETVALTGRLIKKTEATFPPVQINLTAPTQTMDIRAFDPTSQQPLSQLTHVSSGTAASDGTFTIYIDPRAKALTAISLVATPHDPNALMPTKSFTLPNGPYPTGDQLTLELGDYGDALPGLATEDGGLPAILTSDGLPVPHASVWMEGPVAGGGTFHSKTVVTDTSGTFSVESLPSDPAGGFTLTVVPPPDSPASITQRGVTLKLGSNGLPLFAPATVNCEDKVTVTGRLTRPDNVTPAAGVLVTAVPLSPLPEDTNQPMPRSDIQTTTDPGGQFTLLLDPLVWRLEITPGETLPLTSRVILVRRTEDADAGGAIAPFDLGTFPLRKGRQVSGHVSLPAALGGGPAAFATVRFFHVTSVEQKASSLMLGEAVCDEQGNYTVVLPTADR